MDAQPSRLPPWPLAGAMAAAAIVCLTLTFTTYGTNDILFFKSYAAKAARDGVGALYRDGAPLLEFHPDWTEQMAHPPAMIHIWRATQALEDRTRVPFRVWFRIAMLAAHLAIALALYRIRGLTAAVLYCVCPAALVITGFHGNSDPLVVAFLIWAVYAIDEKSLPALAGVLFAASASVKVWPLFLAPAFLLKIQGTRRRAIFAVTAAATFFLLGLPYLAMFPREIARAVLGYRSAAGWWGLSGTWPAYAGLGTPVAFASVLLLTVLMGRRGASLYAICGCAIALFLVLTPGFGVQYLEWILPFCFVFPTPAPAMIYVASSIFLFSFYTKLSGGFPWYFADTLRDGAAKLDILTAWECSACWTALIVALVLLIPGVRRQPA